MCTEIKTIFLPNIVSTKILREAISSVTSNFFILSTKRDVVYGKHMSSRFVQIADIYDANFLYSDHYIIKGNGDSCESSSGIIEAAPVIDYQKGSLRDDFDFGAVRFFRTDVVRRIVGEMDVDYEYGALYDLTLRLSRIDGPGKSIYHINEPLYSEYELDRRRSGEKIFDYVDPKNANIQKEMERIATAHLKAVGAFLKPVLEKCEYSLEFPREVSVVIPVFNRRATIAQAIASALRQKTKFSYNIIVVDNHSTDGTGEIIDALKDVCPSKILHLLPEINTLGIGGCWNEACENKDCGRFAVQLDSDDTYSDDNVLQTIVDKFYQTGAGMVIGSYRMTDFDENVLPAGIIDHKEWTPENGHNNALRINGLGAPRAFYTDIVRKILFPNVSYGEDYAMALRISSNYKIARIYDVLYNCRRWNGNSDASLSREKMNRYNYYKDSIRSLELEYRKKIND